MALKDNILQEFFNVSKQKKEAQSKLEKELEFSAKKRFRVFDEPPLENKSKEKHKTNLGQTEDKPEINSRQTHDNHKTDLRQDLNKPKTEPKTRSKTNIRQTQDSSITFESFISLVGLQREIIFLIYETCKITREKITPPLSVEHIATCCKTTKSSIQKTIQRLEKKGVLIRRNFKNGRGGWTRYELPEMIFQEILHTEIQGNLKTNIGQTKDKVEAQLKTEVKTLLSSSCSNNNINNTTTTETKFGLTEEWEKIDITPLQGIGFSKVHLIQIASQNYLSSKITQDSINAFAFDLHENNKIKTIKGDPINFFMGILRNGKPYNPPSNYESPQDKAMRLYLEQMRVIEQKRADMEREAFELAFKGWFLKLSEKEKLDLLPTPFKARGVEGNKILESIAKGYFEKEVWVKIKQSINEPINEYTTLS